MKIDEGTRTRQAKTRTAQSPLALRPRRRTKGRRRAVDRSRDPMFVAGLFAGIGGIEKGLHTSGHETVLFCENDPGAAEVLRARFGDAEIASDVRELKSLPSEVDLLTAGFPCQDLSQVGTTRGIAGPQSGLIERVFALVERRALAKNPVPWVLLENVPFMLRLSRGQAMSRIIEFLESMGYDWAYRVIDTRAFGLPQRRLRVFILASLEGDPRQVLLSDDVAPREEPVDLSKVACGFYWTEGNRGTGWAVDSVPTLKGGSAFGIPSPPAIILPNGRLVRPGIRDAERLQGFPRDWTKPAENVARANARWKLVGNAVSVPVARWIGRKLIRPRLYEPSAERVLKPGDAWPEAAWGRGGDRFATYVGAWPCRLKWTPLHELLEGEPMPLSERAASGFYSRVTSPQNRLNPPGRLIAALEAHLEAGVQG